MPSLLTGWIDIDVQRCGCQFSTYAPDNCIPFVTAFNRYRHVVESRPLFFFTFISEDGVLLLSSWCNFCWDHALIVFRSRPLICKN